MNSAASPDLPEKLELELAQLNTQLEKTIDKLEKAIGSRDISLQAMQEYHQSCLLLLAEYDRTLISLKQKFAENSEENRIEIKKRIYAIHSERLKGMQKDYEEEIKKSENKSAIPAEPASSGVTGFVENDSAFNALLAQTTDRQWTSDINGSDNFSKDAPLLSDNPWGSGFSDRLGDDQKSDTQSVVLPSSSNSSSSAFFKLLKNKQPPSDKESQVARNKKSKNSLSLSNIQPSSQYEESKQVASNKKPGKGKIVRNYVLPVSEALNSIRKKIDQLKNRDISGISRHEKSALIISFKKQFEKVNQYNAEDLITFYKLWLEYLGFFFLKELNFAVNFLKNHKDEMFLIKKGEYFCHHIGKSEIHYSLFSEKKIKENKSLCNKLLKIIKEELEITNSLNYETDILKLILVRDWLLSREPSSVEEISEIEKILKEIKENAKENTNLKNVVESYFKLLGNKNVHAMPMEKEITSSSGDVCDQPSENELNLGLPLSVGFFTFPTPCDVPPTSPSNLSLEP